MEEGPRQGKGADRLHRGVKTMEVVLPRLKSLLVSPKVQEWNEDGPWTTGGQISLEAAEATATFGQDRLGST